MFRMQVKINTNCSIKFSITAKCNLYSFNFLSGFIKVARIITNFAYIIHLKDLIELFFITNPLFGRIIDFYMHGSYIHRLSVLIQNDLTELFFITNPSHSIIVDYLIRTIPIPST